MFIVFIAMLKISTAILTEWGWWNILTMLLSPPGRPDLSDVCIRDLHPCFPNSLSWAVSVEELVPNMEQLVPAITMLVEELILTLTRGGW